MGSRFEVAVSCSHGEGLDVWDISNGTHLRSIQQFISSHGSLMSIDDEHIICSMTDKAGLVVVNWKTGQIKSRSFLTERIGAISVSSDCSYMAAAGSTSGKVYIWSVKSGLLLKAWNAHYKCVSCLAFTGDDAALVTGGEDAVLNVWLLADLLKHESIDEFQSPPSPFQQWTDHGKHGDDVLVLVVI